MMREENLTVGLAGGNCGSAMGDLRIRVMKDVNSFGLSTELWSEIDGIRL